MVCSILYQSNKHDYRFVLEKYLVTRSRVFILNQTSQNTGKANSSLSHTHTHIQRPITFSMSSFLLMVIHLFSLSLYFSRSFCCSSICRRRSQLACKEQKEPKALLKQGLHLRSQTPLKSARFGTTHRLFQSQSVIGSNWCQVTSLAPQTGTDLQNKSAGSNLEPIRGGWSLTQRVGSFSTARTAWRSSTVASVTTKEVK